MPDVPQVTITDPSDPGEAVDVLDSAAILSPRSARWLGRLLVAGVLVGVGVLATSTVQDRRADARREEAARAEADRVSLAFDDVSVLAGSEGRGAVLGLAQLTRLDAGRTVTAVRWRGEGLRLLEGPPPGVLELATPVQVEAAVDCAAVAAGTVPTGAAVEVDVRPPSGKVVTLRLPVPDGQLRVAAYRSCRLPDPQVRPFVGGATQSRAADGTVNIDVEPVPFGGDLVVRSVRAAGFSVASPFLRLPHTIEQDVSSSLGFVLRVTDCATARGAQLEVVVEQVGRTYVLEPAPPRDEDTVTVADRLARLVADAC